VTLVWALALPLAWWLQRRKTSRQLSRAQQ